MLYQTVPVTSKHKANAIRQEDIVYEFFKRHPFSSYAPPEVQQQVLPYAPLTSIRRAITNLANRGLLEKTDELKQGLWDKGNHCWRLSPQKPQQGRLF